MAGGPFSGLEAFPGLEAKKRRFPILLRGTLIVKLAHRISTNWHAKIMTFFDDFLMIFFDYFDDFYFSV